jgi:hypothetical protein
MEEIMKSFEFAEAHLVNVQQEIERMQQFLQESAQQLQQDKASYQSLSQPAVQTEPATTVPY